MSKSSSNLPGNVQLMASRCLQDHRGKCPKKTCHEMSLSIYAFIVQLFWPCSCLSLLNKRKIRITKIEKNERNWRNCIRHLVLAESRMFCTVWLYLVYTVAIQKVFVHFLFILWSVLLSDFTFYFLAVNFRSYMKVLANDSIYDIISFM